MTRFLRVMEYPMPVFAEIYERIKLATSSRTQVELAEVLDIRPVEHLRRQTAQFRAGRLVYEAL